MTKQIPRNWKNKMGNQGPFNHDSNFFFGHKTQCLVQKHGILQLEKKTKKNENKKLEIN